MLNNTSVYNTLAYISLSEPREYYWIFKFVPFDIEVKHIPSSLLFTLRFFVHKIQITINFILHILFKEDHGTFALSFFHISSALLASM